MYPARVPLPHHQIETERHFVDGVLGVVDLGLVERMVRGGPVCDDGAVEDGVEGDMGFVVFVASCAGEIREGDAGILGEGAAEREVVQQGAECVAVFWVGAIGVDAADADVLNGKAA